MQRPLAEQWRTTSIIASRGRHLGVVLREGQVGVVRVHVVSAQVVVLGVPGAPPGPSLRREAPFEATGAWPLDDDDVRGVRARPGTGDEDRAARRCHDAFGRRADEEVFELRSPVRAHDDHVGADIHR